MNAMRSAIAAVGWVVASTALAQEALGQVEQDLRSVGSAGNSYHSAEDIRLSALIDGLDAAEGAGRPTVLGRDLAGQYVDYISAYRMTPVGEVMARAGFRSLETSTGSAAFIQRQTGIDARPMLAAERWLRADRGLAQMVAVSHAWRDLTLEGAAFSSRDVERPHDPHEIRRIDSRSARLSFSPIANWVVRLTRGTVSGLDHLVAGDEVRRTALSATYKRSFAEGDWEATLAWGRNSRKFRESTVGYLIESAFRFDGIHSVFGRLEQVGSDEIARENESMQRQLFVMNKLTLGYSQDLRITSSLRLDAGAYVTRHFVPSGMASSYGSGPAAYMMFVRVKLQ